MRKGSASARICSRSSSVRSSAWGALRRPSFVRLGGVFPPIDSADSSGLQESRGGILDCSLIIE